MRKMRLRMINQKMNWKRRKEMMATVQVVRTAMRRMKKMQRERHEWQICLIKSIRIKISMKRKVSPRYRSFRKNKRGIEKLRKLSS